MAFRVTRLSTSDNPHDPFTEYDEWYKFDNVEHDYGTISYFDRICKTTREFGEELYYSDIERAIDEAVKFDLISWLYPDVHYIKVVQGEPFKRPAKSKEESSKATN